MSSYGPLKLSAIQFCNPKRYKLAQVHFKQFFINITESQEKCMKNGKFTEEYVGILLICCGKLHEKQRNMDKNSVILE